MKACGEKIVGAEEDFLKQALVWRCKGWHCPHCAEALQSRLRDRARNGRPTLMLTLTNRVKPGLTPSEHARQLVQAWRTIRQAIARQTGEAKVAFIAVFERHRSGYPHLHILLRSPRIDVDWLRKKTIALLDSPQFRVDPVKKAAKAANYVAKYAAKAPEAFDGCKRYWASHSWDDPATKWEKPIADANVSWTLQDLTPAEWQHHYLCRGFEISHPRPGFMKAIPRGMSP